MLNNTDGVNVCVPEAMAEGGPDHAVAENSAEVDASTTGTD